MAVRSTMSDLIALVRTMINDPNPVPGVSITQFTDQQVQDRLDASRDDIRYESLTIAPSIVNTASTNNVAQTIYSDFYSKFQWWEADVVLQAYSSGAFWIVVTPVASDLITGHWQFEANVFTSGTVPGQIPPVFATGKVFDCYRAAADLLEFWAATSLTAYDVTTDGQTLRRSQMTDMRMKAAAMYRRQAKPRSVKMTRPDVLSPISTRHMRLLDEDDSMK